MTSKTRVKSKASPTGLLQVEKWQKIQNLFAKIIGANITFLNSSNENLTKSSRVTSSCSEIALPLEPSSSANSDCLSLVLQNGLHKRKSFVCAHRLHFFGLRIQLQGKSVGALIIGPVLVGKRENEQSYRKLCKELGIQEENFLDRILEIKLFSHTGICTVLDFLHEIIESFLRIASQKKDLKRLTASFLSGSKETGRFFSSVYSSELADALIDIALGVVGGDSGSVLLFDKRKKSFSVKSARGIRSEVLREIQSPLRDGVANYVASRGKPLLIQKEVKDPILRGRLKREEICSSIVVPMTFLGRTLGVFCVNAEADNHRFNQDNLLLLDQLGRLASIAFARLGAE